MSKFNVLRYKELWKSSTYNQNDIALRVGVGVDTVKNWTRTKYPATPEQDTIRALSHLFNVPMSELDNDVKRDVDMTLKVMNNQDFTMIDYVDLKAGAGSEGVLLDYFETSPTPINKQFLNGTDPKNLIMIQVVGDSMQPTINAEEFVIIDMVNNRYFDEINGVYLVNMDGTIQIKRLEFLGSKGVDIISDNNLYQQRNTLKDGIDLNVLGKLFKQVKSYGSLAIKGN